MLAHPKVSLFLPEQAVKGVWLLNLQTFPNRFDSLKAIMPNKNVKNNMENRICLACLVENAIVSVAFDL